ncbi:Uncharacterised protein [Shigella flexneri]|nr:Uncharacterised protein [Shigella flexneri]
MSDLAMKVLKWQSTGDVGISSATLASIACGLKKMNRPGNPGD